MGKYLKIRIGLKEINGTNIIFFGGEDYELVFSLPKKWSKNLSKLDKDITEIGFFADGEPSIEFNDNKKNKIFNNTPFKHF